MAYSSGSHRECAIETWKEFLDHCRRGNYRDLALGSRRTAFDRFSLPPILLELPRTDRSLLSSVAILAHFRQVFLGPSDCGLYNSRNNHQARQEASCNLDSRLKWRYLSRESDPSKDSSRVLRDTRGRSGFRCCFASCTRLELEDLKDSHGLPWQMSL